MADKSFGVKELNLLNASGTPTVTSPNNLNLNANTVAISTSCTIGSNLTVSGNIDVDGTTNLDNVDIVGITTIRNASGNKLYEGSANASKLFHNGSERLQTETYGIDINGTLGADQINCSGVSTITVPANANPHSSWDVVNNSASSYRFTGPGQDGAEDNPDIYLVRGQRYVFKMNASGHPFQIRVANGGAAYSDGVTNNGAQTGNVVFNVQHDAPAQLYYQCTSHGGMVGNIYIVGGSQVISGVVTATTFSGNLSGGTVSGTTGTFSGNLSVAQNIVHTGDTDTKIEFLTDTISLDTAGSERLRINSNGGLIKYGNNINLNSAYIDFSGSISTPSTAAAIFRPADNTLAFSTANVERIRVTNGGLDPSTDAVSDLGNSSKRYRDLYLSSGVFLGGTSSSNELHDYEEGSWSPAFKAGNNSTACPTNVSEAKYTKIGRLVTATAYFTMSSYAAGGTGGDTRIVGLPFTNVGDHGSCQINYWTSLKQNITFMAGTVQGSTSEILIRATTAAASGTSNIDFDNTFGPSDSLILTATYHASS